MRGTFKVHTCMHAYVRAEKIVLNELGDLLMDYWALPAVGVFVCFVG